MKNDIPPILCLYPVEKHIFFNYKTIKIGGIRYVLSDSIEKNPRPMIKYLLKKYSKLKSLEYLTPPDIFSFTFLLQKGEKSHFLVSNKNIRKNPSVEFKYIYSISEKEGISSSGLFARYSNRLIVDEKSEQVSFIYTDLENKSADNRILYSSLDNVSFEKLNNRYKKSCEEKIGPFLSETTITFDISRLTRAALEMGEKMRCLNLYLYIQFLNEAEISEVHKERFVSEYTLLNIIGTHPSHHKMPKMCFDEFLKQFYSCYRDLEIPIYIEEILKRNMLSIEKKKEAGVKIESGKKQLKENNIPVDDAGKTCVVFDDLRGLPDIQLFRTTIDQVTASYGHNYIKEKPFSWSCLTFPDHFLTVWYDETSINRLVLGIDIDYPFPAESQKGICLGKSTLADVIAEYGPIRSTLNFDNGINHSVENGQLRFRTPFYKENTISPAELKITGFSLDYYDCDEEIPLSDITITKNSVSYRFIPVINTQIAGFLMQIRSQMEIYEYKIESEKKIENPEPFIIDLLYSHEILCSSWLEKPSLKALSGSTFFSKSRHLNDFFFYLYCAPYQDVPERILNIVEPEIMSVFTGKKDNYQVFEVDTKASSWFINFIFDCLFVIFNEEHQRFYLAYATGSD